MRPEEQAQVGPVGVVKHREPHPPFLRAHPPCEPEDEGGGRRREGKGSKGGEDGGTHINTPK